MTDSIPDSVSSPPPGPAPSLWWLHWGGILGGFAIVQALVQFCGALAGLLIVRNLAKDDYALFAIANSMQTTGNLLAELGIGLGLRSIGGRVWNDPWRFGQLLNTALRLRRRFAVFSLAVTVPAAGWMLWRNGASVQLVAGLCLCLTAGVIPLLGASVFTTSLQLHAEYQRMQRLDLANALLRFGLIAGLAATRINSILATAVGVLGNWVQLIVARRWVRDVADTAAPPNDDDRLELLRLSLKSLPNAVFFCFQGQVTLLILTLGNNPAGIAEITAIGRIAALFAIFSAVFASVLAPRFARCQEPARLQRLYLLLVGMTVLALAPLVLLSWVLPDPFLRLLGEDYAGLESACGWVVAAGCVGQIASVMWGLNASKAWIRVQAVGFIPIILASQTVAALCLDLRSFHDVLIFNLVTAAAPLPIYTLDAWWGLRTARSGPET